MLQLGHAISRVESEPVIGPQACQRWASIGPRDLTRGKRNSLDQRVRGRIGFNWATRSHAWKGLSSTSCLNLRLGFNWATRSHAWKVLLSGLSCTRWRASIGPRDLTRGKAVRGRASDRRSGGFNWATRSHAWKEAVWCPRGCTNQPASIGPRDLTRGKGSCQTYLCATSKLASIGPRDLTRGKRKTVAGSGCNL